MRAGELLSLNEQDVIAKALDHSQRLALRVAGAKQS
jgi:hypothetical protein